MRAPIAHEYALTFVTPAHRGWWEADAAAVLVSCASGPMKGLISGYTGGRLDTTSSARSISRSLSVVVLLEPSVQSAVIAVGISVIPWCARVVRGAVKGEGKKQNFEAAESLEAEGERLDFRHMHS